MMNIQELATIKRYQLPIKIVIVDNQALGMVRQQQQLFYAGRYSEIDLLDNPDFCGLAAAFDIPAQQIRCEAQLDAGIDALLSQSGPFLLHLCTSAKQNVWPIVKPGATNKHMIIGEQTR